ncbi:Hypothetical predicted protein [Pelobates cultripes]|uniref:Uncharacterized protein n=1 Tax=Pelobates cultripes TaxID=61616 RepID=A0AAD1WX75_PELCU|nr:Hypothetical predicted protein [Pelobates cultripes]
MDTIKQYSSPEAHRVQSSSYPARPTAHVDSAAVWTAHSSSELGTHQEESLYSQPYTEGEDREPVEPWALDPDDGINGQFLQAPLKPQAEDKWSLDPTTP